VPLSSCSCLQVRPFVRDMCSLYIYIYILLRLYFTSVSENTFFYIFFVFFKIKTTFYVFRVAAPVFLNTASLEMSENYHEILQHCTFATGFVFADLYDADSSDCISAVLCSGK